MTHPVLNLVSEIWRINCPLEMLITVASHKLCSSHPHNIVLNFSKCDGSRSSVLLLC